MDYHIAGNIEKIVPSTVLLKTGYEILQCGCGLRTLTPPNGVEAVPVPNKTVVCAFY